MSLNENLIKNAANKKVMSRIALKIDTWEKWQEEAAQNLVLHAGEVAFVQVGSVPPMPVDKNSNGAKTDNVHLNVEPNQILFKVGDGVSKFKDLVWGSAKAADVYDWAKVSSANIVEISYGSGDNETKSTLSEFLEAFETYKTSNDEAILGINGELETLSGKVAGLEGLVGGDANFATKDDVANAVSAAKTELVGTSSVTGVVSTIKEASAQAIAAATAADEAKQSAKTANDWIDEHKDVKHITVEEMNKAISDADDAVKEALVGNDTTANTIKYAIKQASEAGTAAGQARTVADRAEDKVGTLICTETIEVADPTDENPNNKKTVLKDAGKSVRTIANEELAAQLLPASAKESLDTLQEIAAWIQSHPDDAAELNRLLAGLGTTGEGTSAKAKTVKEYVDAAVEAEGTARAGAITTAIQSLDMPEVKVGADETIEKISETDGVVSVTTQKIEITKSQISDFDEDDYATAGHDHDNDYAGKTEFNTHVSKAVTTETYLLIDCGTSTINVD